MCIHCHLRAKKPGFDWCPPCITWGHEVRREAEAREAARRVTIR